ncbi:glycosyltransferase family 4 protein [Dietzia sp. ANT_WB102]|uniref:glycosyltransferase family 4 protein n=1 Tax=Dietzia sp. ANT_WB102 TaxID=2597345 RepID=UPI0011EE8E9B|nr:glycosyltransferase family 4 protein [Dietzia sp. ANT_WB102]KAA0918908.1 glycosyltransferase family 4 protein [Dietzia sp. ANT_WB102]
MKIGYVTQWFDPETGSAATPGIIARALNARGHDVEVLTGLPNYPEGRLYDGYGLVPYQREERDGMTVHRSPLIPTHESRAISRILNYSSFAAGATAVGARVLRHADVVLVHSTPATVAVPALAAKALYGVPFVPMIQDLWPDTVTSSGFLADSSTSGVERTLHRFCDTVYRQAARIAVISPGMSDSIQRRGIPPEKITFTPNWVDETTFYPESKDDELRRSFGLTRDFVVMYAGNFGEFQALDLVLAAAERLRTRSDIQFALVGGGVMEQALKRISAEKQLDNVVFVPSQPFSAMTKVLALGDLHLVSLQDLPLFRITLPSKLQATLAAGRPLVGTVRGDAATVIEDSGAGLTSTPEDPDDLARAVAQMADDPEGTAAMGRAGREYYERVFSEDSSAGRLVSVLEMAASERKRGRR